MVCIGSGQIEYDEFLKMMTTKILNRDPKDEILKAFRSIPISLLASIIIVNAC